MAIESHNLHATGVASQIVSDIRQELDETKPLALGLAGYPKLCEVIALLIRARDVLHDLNPDN